MRYYTSDTHFGHGNVIKYCNRPFSNRHEMDSALIANWNAIVGPEDEVFHLGDFALGADERKILPQLRGKLHLVAGNHDPSRVRKNPRWLSCNNELLLDAAEGRVVMRHIPLDVWAADFHLHGHTHGNSHPLKNRVDVGVDAQGYKPVTLEQLLQQMSLL